MVLYRAITQQPMELIIIMSVLEEAPGYSIINGLPHDIMHDLYEGIVPYELKLLLRHCLNSMYFTVDELNGRIERYGFDCNEPRLLYSSAIRGSESKIRQSASQMMSPSHNLPLVIGDKIPEDDRHWVSFLLLLRICQISNSPICSPDTICYLRVLIEVHLRKCIPMKNSYQSTIICYIIQLK